MDYNPPLIYVYVLTTPSNRSIDLKHMFFLFLFFLSMKAVAHNEITASSAYSRI